MKKSKKNKKTFLIIGLGNPGKKYQGTRHNAGFRVIDRISERLDCRLKKPLLKNYLIARVFPGHVRMILVKPLTYMNRSGMVLPGLLKKYLSEGGQLVVVCDNMDLRPGEIRLKSGGSSAGHNGIKSILERTRDLDFLRLYVGVGRPSPGIGVVQHVLESPDRDDGGLIAAAEERAAHAVLELPENGLARIMNEYNRKQN